MILGNSILQKKFFVNLRYDTHFYKIETYDPLFDFSPEEALFINCDYLFLTVFT